ncbi:MAG: TetR/AcrR family transcriptional regulator C-terminal domain-containing protein [Eggerthellaceae bacterium]|nr:TetR/AcrR family transcriptional regulator C-terminal domain-containing protein [Eggerthellaceae bacterium]
MRDKTKWLFARTLADMLGEKSLEKIHVNELCERCGEHRQLFYYHFRDKYDLVAWIYDQEYAAAISSPQCTDYRSLVILMLENLWEHREFYRKAFADKTQNSIERHIHETNLEESGRLLRRYCGVRKLSREQTHAILFHSFGSVGTAIEWLRGNLKATPAELADWHFSHIPDFLREAHEAEVLEHKR